MNTSDVRNMKQSQWLFWVCAIPFTIVVMGISVLIVQNVESLRQGWATLVDYKTVAMSGPPADEEVEGREAEEEEDFAARTRTRSKGSLRFS